MDSLNWDKVKFFTSKSGTAWKVIDPGCQWQNGAAESMVKAVKSTLGRVLGSPANLPNFAEMDTMFSVVADIINSRPLAVKSLTETDITAICPNDLLLGRAQSTSSMSKFQEGETLTSRVKAVEELTARWWDLWYQQVFPSLVPFPKWATLRRSVRVGDVVLVLYKHKYDKGVYKLGRVLETHPGQDSEVRRVTVGLSQPSRSSKQHNELVKLTLGVQKLVVIFPVEEQVGSSDAQEQLPVIAAVELPKPGEAQEVVPVIHEVDLPEPSDAMKVVPIIDKADLPKPSDVQEVVPVNVDLPGPSYAQEVVFTSLHLVQGDRDNVSLSVVAIALMVDVFPQHGSP